MREDDGDGGGLREHLRVGSLVRLKGLSEETEMEGFKQGKDRDFEVMEEMGFLRGSLGVAAGAAV